MKGNVFRIAVSVLLHVSGAEMNCQGLHDSACASLAWAAQPMAPQTHPLHASMGLHGRIHDLRTRIIIT